MCISVEKFNAMFVIIALRFQLLEASLLLLPLPPLLSLPALLPLPLRP
jgi:hypothetical protein